MVDGGLNAKTAAVRHRFANTGVYEPCVKGAVGHGFVSTGVNESGVPNAQWVKTLNAPYVPSAPRRDWVVDG